MTEEHHASLLRVTELKTYFGRRGGLLSRRGAPPVRAVDGVSFTLDRGEVLGLVGESGCGKSTLARTLTRLCEPTQGRVMLGDVELHAVKGEALRRELRRVQMVFQDPDASLDPHLTVFATLADAVRVRARIADDVVRAQVVTLLERVGMVTELGALYPHQLSGGQRQRVAIARALAVDPEVIVADEPVSALDVSVQAQILNLLLWLCRELELGLLFISHDIGVVRLIADRVAVMYLGRLVEVGPAAAVVDSPLHPYTRALVSAVPRPDPQVERQRIRTPLEGEPPSPVSPPPGCAFHPRCPYRDDLCAERVPALGEVEKNRLVACLHHEAMYPDTASLYLK